MDTGDMLGASLSLRELVHEKRAHTVHRRVYSPGRFFAANLMKTMLAHIIVNYDMKFEREGVRPDNVHGVLSVQPDLVARVLFRKRVSSLT